MLLNELWMVLITASAVAGLLALVPVSTATPQPVANAGEEDSANPSTTH
jgi:hypothetical protein